MRALDYEVVIPKEFHSFFMERARILLGRGSTSKNLDAYDRLLVAIERATEPDLAFVVEYSDLHYFISLASQLQRDAIQMRDRTAGAMFHHWLGPIIDGARAQRATSVIDFIGEIE